MTEAAVDRLPDVRPGGSGLWNVGRPQDVSRPDEGKEPRQRLIPGVEVALAVEQLGRGQVVAFVGQAIVVGLMVGPLEIERRPAQSTFGEYHAQPWVAHQNA